jgi:hypothetical protein
MIQNIHELQEANQKEVVVEEVGTVLCSLHVVVLVVIYVVMQWISFECIAKCSIVNEITQLTWSIVCYYFIDSLSLKILSCSSEWWGTELLPELCNDWAAFWALTSLEFVIPLNMEYLQHTWHHIYIAWLLHRQSTRMEALSHRPWFFPHLLAHTTIVSTCAFLQSTPSPWHLTIYWPYWFSKKNTSNSGYRENNGAK